MKTHVYFMELPFPDNEKLALIKKQAQTCVTGERRKKLEELQLPKAILQSASGILLLNHGRKKIGEILKQSFDSPMEIDYRENGKPYFPKEPELYFNISHTDSCVMCVLSNREIGCDIERKREVNLQMAKRFFHPKEYERVFHASAREQSIEEFFRIWTKKESLLKSTGDGLRRPLDSFCVLEDTLYEKLENQEKTYAFKEFSFQEYCAAICMEQSAGETTQEVFCSFQKFTDMVY